MNKKYQIIYADPPWSYNDKMKGHSFSLEDEYQTQSLIWIKNLDINGQDLQMIGRLRYVPISKAEQ